MIRGTLLILPGPQIDRAIQRTLRGRNFYPRLLPSPGKLALLDAVPFSFSQRLCSPGRVDTLYSGLHFGRSFSTEYGPTFWA